jgi:pyruvate carboxylase subunit B
LATKKRKRSKKTTAKAKRVEVGRQAGSAKARGAKRGASGKGGARPVGIMDTTLRDGHQCLLATRMRTEDMLPILGTLDDAGFAALEVWGGATFDATHRFLNEDPWERLATFKRGAPKTPLQMLLRGQNLVGYRHYPDDVVEAFIEKAAETGIDRFRVFDALNDERNMKTSFEAVRRAGKHIQGTVCYTITERKLGGKIYNTKYYVEKVKILEEMGADSICLKDMAGLLAPMDAYELISAFKSAVKLPVQLHTHYTSGFASMTALKAVEAGVDIVDCALAPLALRTGQPAVEPLLVTLQGEARDPGIALEPLIECGKHLERIAPKYRHLLDTTRMAPIDAEVLVHQVPGGMMSNLVNQLREAKAVDRLREVLDELPKTRADLGYPPLVTPSSQIVGTQAVMNVLFGRYERITQPVKDLAAGLYGKTPAPIDRDVQKKCLEGHKYSKPITKRPADLLEPELDKAKEAVKDITSDLRDVLTYAIYPTTGLRFLKWKYGVEEPPAEVKPRTLEEARHAEELVEKARKGLLVEPPDKQAPAKSGALRSFNVFVDGEYFEVEVDPRDGQPRLAAAAPVAAATRPTAAPTPQASAEPAPAAASKSSAPPAPAAAPAASSANGAIVAPMPGLVIEYRVDPGDVVAAGDVVCILEAMKMQNEIRAERAGTVSKIHVATGATVDKGAPLVEIE